MRSQQHNDTKVLWSLLGIAIVAGFVGGHLDWHSARAGVAGASSASAIGALASASSPLQLTLGFAGGISIDKTIAATVQKNYKGDYSQLFAGADFLKVPDITFASLESPTTSTNPSLSSALKGAGINVVSLANDDVSNWGRPAFEDTIAGLRQSGILVCGAGMNKTEAETPAVVQQNGLRVGFLCFSGGTSDDSFAASGVDSGMLLASDPDFDSIVTTAARQVNALVVSFSWTGGQTAESATQEQLAQKAVDDGASMVVGDDPQAVQETVEYHARPIVYSLGSFISDQPVGSPAGTFLSATLTGPAISDIVSHPIVLDGKYAPSIQPTTQ